MRIAWLGPAPGGYSGVRGVATELLGGLARRGHTIDCFLPAAENQSAAGVAGDEQVRFGEGDMAFGENVTLVWGTSRWQWDRWYSRGKMMAFASGMVSRSVASLRLRREIARRHRRRPYDVIYQFSSIETPGVPTRLARSVPLVIHPETHAAGELRWLISERRLSFASQPPYMLPMAVAMFVVRSIVQRRSIRRARLVVCISSVFRDHLVRDYGLPAERTVVVPNPMRAERFAVSDRTVGRPARVLVLGRISTRKGIDDVIALAGVINARGIPAHLRVAGGPTLWSDYTKLLTDLPSESSEYAGHLAASEVPGEIGESDMLLQPSKYEPFGLTVAEALAAGVPVIGTSEVGAIEGVDRGVVAEVAVGDVEGMADAIERTLSALADDSTAIHALARSEAERLFAPDSVCERIATALEALAPSSQ
jgi:glycosyltransferase involved in cell wall biosynthesis